MNEYAPVTTSQPIHRINRAIAIPEKLTSDTDIEFLIIEWSFTLVPNSMVIIEMAIAPTTKDVNAKMFDRYLYANDKRRFEDMTEDRFLTIGLQTLALDAQVQIQE